MLVCAKNMFLSKILTKTLTCLVNEVCGEYEQLLDESSFCLGYNGHNSGCNGDSGSPLVCRGKEYNQFVIVGVASWASMDCAPNAPTGFAEVSAVIPWIKSIIEK